ncbi:TIGR02530 family flagellar biosynthesis protein [Carboxydothermus ferrireducens]|uniref:Flagellar operon protein n=1 Tax=Carboxydothermus ferrireducens DSM 11255 TaxID=1119529 RepID=A0ABX2RAV9_9THEO|nr:TIGR02530 family flagellar biosynthesis protein [Carboxydothermus ferrireducens]NYE56903.1 flagellar operon protein [Carboxydothermus ferrireducens DSM 11255]
MSNIGKIQGLITVNEKPAAQTLTKAASVRSFEQLLQETEAKLKVSHHAEKRLQERGIELSEQEWLKISRALENARAKGARNSLVVYGDLAIIASVVNKTVITVSRTEQLAEQIITNIDSAILLK